MRKGFERRVERVIREVWDITLFEYVVLFSVVSLIGVLMSEILDMPLWISFVIGAGVAAGAYILGFGRGDVVEKIERENPFLEDRFGTAIDNEDKDNIVVKDLINQVYLDLGKARTDSLLHMRRVGLEIGISVIVVFLLLFLMFIGFEGVDIGGFIGGSSGGSGGGGGNSGQGGGSGGGEGGGNTPADQEVSMGMGDTQNIFGNPTVAKIEGKDIELEIHPEYGEGMGTGEEGGKGPQTNPTTAQGVSVEAVSSNPYTENIPAELEELVRSYFEKVAEG